MPVFRKDLGRQNAEYPRIELIAINNTGAALTASDIGKAVVLDWTPSGTATSAIAITSANQAKYRKALVIDLLKDAGATGKRIKVLLQGEDFALLPNSVAQGDALQAVGSTNSGATALTAIAANASTGGLIGTSSISTPITSVANALAANATSGSLISTAIFFDGTVQNVISIKRDGA